RLLGNRTSAPVYFTTGFKVMEVQQDSALVWTRLCCKESANPARHERRVQVFRHPVDFDEQQPVDKMDGAVPCCCGMVQMTLRNGQEVFTSGWMKVSDEKDFTASFLFRKLRSNTPYELEIEAKSSVNGPVQTARGSFATLPDPAEEKPVHFVTSTCQYFWSFDD